jgi:hypothetical protein
LAVLKQLRQDKRENAQKHANAILASLLPNSLTRKKKRFLHPKLLADASEPELASLHTKRETSPHGQRVLSQPLTSTSATADLGGDQL